MIASLMGVCYSPLCSDRKSSPSNRQIGEVLKVMLTVRPIIVRMPEELDGRLNLSSTVKANCHWLIDRSAMICKTSHRMLKTCNNWICRHILFFSIWSSSPYIKHLTRGNKIQFPLHVSPGGVKSREMAHVQTIQVGSEVTCVSSDSKFVAIGTKKRVIIYDWNGVEQDKVWNGEAVVSHTLLTSLNLSKRRRDELISHLVFRF